MVLDMSEERSPPQTAPGQHKPAFVRPPYLKEDPWTSSTPPKDQSHWTRIRELLTKGDAGTIGAWQEEINTQLLVVSDLVPFPDVYSDRHYSLLCSLL